MRTKMLSIADITLAKAIDMCRAEEITSKRSQELSVPYPEVEVNKVAKRFQNKSRARKEVKENSTDSKELTQSGNDGSSDESEDEYEIGKIFDNSSKGGGVMAELELKFSNQWKSVICEVDTGANTSLIGHNWLAKLTGDANPKLLPSTYRLQSFGGNPIKVLGEVKIPCRRLKRRYRLVLQVVDVDHQPLLSAKASRVLGFVKFCKSVTFGKSDDAKSSLLRIHTIEAEKIIGEHKEIFSGYGKFDGQVSLEVDPSISPSIQPPRRVPIAMRNKLKKELESLE